MPWKKKHLHLDWETRSDVDLATSGLYLYAKGKNTDILCAAYAFDDEPIKTWLPGQTVPQDVFDHIEGGGEVWAHNASFERDICNYIGTRKYGWPFLYNQQLVCTMAMAYSMGLPGTLERCAAALGVSEQKDMEGARLMKQMCLPREVLPNGRILWWDEPAKIQRLLEYCIQDVRTEREASKRMLPLSAYEKKVWILDQIINDRGIKVNVQAAFKASQMVEEEKASLNKEIQRVSNGEIATCTAVAQIKTFLSKNGVADVSSIDKASALEILKGDIPEVCRKVLDLRAQAGKSSTAKLEPMIQGAATDHRVRGNFQYSGAGTRRWSGRRLQLHNLKRPSIESDQVERIIRSLGKLNREAFTSIWGAPMDVVSDLMRGLLISENGKELIACDFSAIEARVVAWLAGQNSVLDVFRRDEDVYVHAAHSIFGKSDISKSERAVGKVAVLALGFGGGVGAFQTMAKGYGVTMAPAFRNLYNRASERQQQFVESAFKSNGKKFDISREEYIASDLTKMFWREDNREIVQFWVDLENAAIEAVQTPGSVVRNAQNNISYKKSGSFLFCQLPSKGVIVYPYPEIVKVKTPWGTDKMALKYKAEDSQTKQWLEFTTYGGSLTENVVQSVARDLLADSMLRIEYELKYPIVLHVHDEIVVEMPVGEGSLEKMRKIMATPPAWAKDLPLDGSGWVGENYKK